MSKYICKCGGKFRRIDIRAVVGTERHPIMTMDGCNRVATWNCTKCGKVRTQRKRQPKSGQHDCLDGCHKGEKPCAVKLYR